MKNRKIKYNLRIFAIVLIMGLATVSCEKYLNKAPEATISDKDAFGNFISFQGFIEEMYNCYFTGVNNEADEMLKNSPLDFDQGNYWGSAGGGAASTDDSNKDKDRWTLCWYGIRKANIALSKLDLLVNATQEEKDLIKGQALFFRGWFHFELMRYWGGMPYIDKVLSSAAGKEFPRLSYRETALKAAKDFEEAATLLPVKWDDTGAGNLTSGDNNQRISKVFALGYLGKDLLYAASPMMNEESTGNASFDAELCKQAAEAFAEAIKVCDETGAYKLQTWDTWTDNFWVFSPGNTVMSGGTEAIMNQTIIDLGNVQFLATHSTPVQMGGINAEVEVPTHNYLKNYGMANGLPIDDPLSNYNPNDPWAGREPRFYVDIVIDGDELAATPDAALDRYAQLYNGGRHKGGLKGSVTGYYYKKWSPKGCNRWENKWKNFVSYVPYMRLADVYLMYAEAVFQGYGTAQSSVPGSITAEAAVNIIRNRAQLANLTSAYTTKAAFMDVIIRERAVELGFENHRFCDLRRWNLAGEMKYREKTALDFDRDSNKKPINIKERVIVTRVFDKRNNWFPIQVSFTKLYKEFPQNPGW